MPKNIKSTSRWQRLQQQHNFLQVRVLSAVVYLAYAAGYFLATALQDGPPFPNRAVTISETPGGVGIGDGICFFPPARWGSLDFNPGATPPPSPPPPLCCLDLLCQFRCSGSRLDPNSTSPATDAVGCAGAGTFQRECQTQCQKDVRSNATKNVRITVTARINAR